MRNSEAFGRIFISTDMTREEREKDKKLREEKLKSEREGETRQGYK